MSGWTSLLVITALSLTPALHADEADDSASSRLKIENPFHFITHKCEAESGEEAESTPQSPPLEVDDPGTPGCNTWEINIVADGDLTVEQNTFELPLLDINYGIGDNLQLKYEIPYLDQQSEGQARAAMGESIVGVKYMFFNDEKTETQMAVYPQRTIVDAKSDAVKKGLVSAGAITTLPFLLSRKLGETANGDVEMTVNLGYNFSTKEDVGDFISSAFGLGAPLSHRLSLLSEVAAEFSTSANADGEREQLAKVDLGIIGTLNKHFEYLASVGHQLYSSDHQDHTYALVGFRILEGGVRR